MSDYSKVVIFSVEVPDKDQMVDQVLVSPQFNTEFEDANGDIDYSSWIIKCNFNHEGSNKFVVGLNRLDDYDERMFSDMMVYFSLISQDSNNVEHEYLKSSTHLESATNEVLNAENEILISCDLEDLISNEDSYYPDGSLHIRFKFLNQRWQDLNPGFQDVAIINEFSRLFESMKFPDVIIEVTEDGKPKLFKAHRAILCARSKVFDAMLTTEMTEKFDGKIIIKDVNAPVMQELLRFIYCSKVEKIDGFDIELYEIAHRFDITNLPELCLQSMYERLTKDNAVEIAIFANTFDHQDLFYCSTSIIRRNYESISSTEDWKKIDPNVRFQLVDSILKREIEKDLELSSDELEEIY